MNQQTKEVIHDAIARQLSSVFAALGLEIITEVVESAVVVPELALRYEGDQTFVELATGAGADSLAPRGGSLPPERRSVEIGIVDRDRVQILSGLAPGERVVLD